MKQVLALLLILFSMLLRCTSSGNTEKDLGAIGETLQNGDSIFE